MIGKDYPRKRIYNWRKIYEKDGELVLQTDYNNHRYQWGLKKMTPVNTGIIY